MCMQSHKHWIRLDWPSRVMPGCGQRSPVSTSGPTDFVRDSKAGRRRWMEMPGSGHRDGRFRASPLGASPLSPGFRAIPARTEAASRRTDRILMEPEPDARLEGLHSARVSSINLVARSDRARSDRGHASAGATQLEFMQLALHDLQTPVAVLDLSMKLLADDLAGAGPEALATLRGAERAVRRIQQYIDHLVTSERSGPKIGRAHV